MDFDPRGDDRFGSMKLAARTDLVSFPLKMAANFGSSNAGPINHMVPAGGGVSLVRSNSMAGQPDNNNGRPLGGAGCSPTTSSTTSDGCALLGNDGSYTNMQQDQQEAAAMRSYIMSSSCGRSMNAEALAMASYMGNAQRAMGLYNQGHGANYMMMAAGGGVAHDGDLMAQAANIFTASQLRELQLHALIFKHLMCGVNVPPELSLPIRTSVAASLGWGHFHLGYGGNSFDPEPGRCRRTDGKKWRCSRDVVPDQKYCERHMHRGRHRARKLAPEAGQLAANTNTATTNSGSSINPSSTTASTTMPNSGISCASGGGGGGASRSGAQLPPVSGHSTPGTPLRHPATSSFINPGGGGAHQMSGHASGGGGSGGALSIASTTAASFPNQHHHHQFGGGGTNTPPSTRPDLRYVCGTDLGSQEPSTFFSDARGLSLESPSSLSSGMSAHAGSAGAINEPSLMMRSVMQSKQQEQAQSFLGAFDDNAGGRDPDQAGQPLRHFFDDWPRSRPDATSSTGLAWPADEDVMDQNLVDDDHRTNRSSSTTQLSISIPITVGGSASSSNGSSPRGKLAGPALKLSMMSSSNASSQGGTGSGGGSGDQLEAAATHMGLGVGTLLANEEEVAIIHHEQPRTEEGVFLAGRSGGPGHHAAPGGTAMSWVPITWGGRNHHDHNSGNSGAGGPLAEALHNSSNSSTPRGQPASAKNHNNSGGAGSSGAPLNLMGGGATGRTEHSGWHMDGCTATSPTAPPGQMQYSTSGAPGLGSGSASPRHRR